MSGLGGFLFGNIDDEGRIDNDDFDEELKANLSLFTERLENKKLLGLDSIVEEETNEEKAKIPSAVTKPQLITPLPEAENFEEINELAEDQQKTLSPLVSTLEMHFEVPRLEEPKALPVSTLSNDDLQVVPFDCRQILKFSRLSAPPPLLNATGRSFSRYSGLRKLRPKKRNFHNKQIVPVENQIETFLSKMGVNIAAPSAAASRLRLSLVNLNSASSNALNSNGSSSSRQKEIEEALEEVKKAIVEFEQAHPQGRVALPENSHFHSLSITPWEDQIMWSLEDNHKASGKENGMFVNIAGPALTSTNLPTNKISAPGSGPSSSSLPSSSGPSLSSILSSLSLSGSGIGGDSATATALLALIRNQHMQRSASLSSLNSSTSSLRATTPIMTRSPSLASRQASTPQPSLKYPKCRAARILNRSLEEGNWTDSIIWDPREVDPAKLQTHLILPFDDPQLVFTTHSAEHLSKKLSRAEKLIAKRLKKLRSPAGTASESLYIASYARPLPDKFNISNDKYYDANDASNGATTLASTSKATEAAKIQSATASSSSSSIAAAALGLSSSVPALQHSVPALKLSSPAFQTCRTKRELRLWHRPKLAYPAGFEIDSWAKVKFAAKKSSIGMTLDETIGSLPTTLHVNQTGGVMRSFKKLTLRDSSRFLLLEYSEEFPPLLLNPGMGTYVVLFYRKKSPQDTFVPSSTFATVQVLDFTDPSPFWMFGDVPAGTSRYALCNGLFRAPLFPHQTSQSDFLCGRRASVGGGADDDATSAGPEFFLRPLDLGQVFCAGQVFPVIEVPGPHSRRHNQLCRNRLQVAAYRLFQKDLTGLPTDPTRRRLKISRLLTAFPQFSEGSIRKWLKEYAESTRAARDSGVWLLKTDAPQLDEDDLRNLMTPEMLCSYESMMAEQQRISDAEVILFDPLVKDAGKKPSALDEAAAVDDIQSETESVSTTAPAAAKKRTRSAGNLSGPLADIVRTTPWQLTANFLTAVQGRTTLQLRGLGDPSGHGEGFSFIKASASNMIFGKSGITLTPTSNEYRQEISKIWEAQVSALSSAAQTRNEPVLPDSFSPSIVPGSKLNIQRRVGDELVNETIEDPWVIAAYLRSRLQAAAASQNDKKFRRGFVAPDALPVFSGADMLHNTPIQAFKKDGKPRPSKASSSSNANKNLQIKCGACGLVGHMRTNRVCPLFGQVVPEVSSSSIANSGNESSTLPGFGLKLKLKVVGQVGSGSSNDSTLSSTDSIFPSPVLIPVSHRAKGPPIQPLPPKPRKRPRKLTPKQQHSLFLSTLSPENRAQLVALSSHLVAVVDSILALPTTLAFHKPVSRRLYPLYYKMILQPIDLSGIRTKAVALMYLNSADLIEDFVLMARNCDQFNGKGSPLSLVALDMLERLKSGLENDTIKELDAFLVENVKAPAVGEDVHSDFADEGAHDEVEVSIVTDAEEDSIGHEDAEPATEPEPEQEQELELEQEQQLFETIAMDIS